MAQILTDEHADITLGYWGIRGLAQPIRSLLVFADVRFSEVRLGVFQDGALMNRVDEDEDWERIRSTLDMPFPNLPYLIDTTPDTPVKLSQSNAILRYLARRFGYYGSSDPDRIEIDVLQDEAYDFRNEIVKTAYTLGDDYDEAYENFVITTLPVYLGRFESYLEKREIPKYFVGDRLSLVDFVLHELLWQITIMVPQAITKSMRPVLYEFIRHFESMPQYIAYQQSDNYIRRPVNSPWASFH